MRQAFRKNYKIDLKAGRKYAFDLASTEFVGYLLLENEAHFQLAEDYDPGGKGHARFTYAPSNNAPFVVIVTTVGRGTGAFKLTVREDSAASPAAVAKSTPPKESGVVAAGKSVEVRHVSNNGLEVTVLNLPGDKIVGDLIWTPEGDAFFALTNEGVLSRVALKGFVVEKRLDMARRCSFLACPAKGCWRR